MYNNKIINTREQIEEKDLLEIEERYGFTFPESFRKHYLKYNSGTTEKDIFIMKSGEKIEFTYFYSIKRKDDKGLELKSMLKTNFAEDSIFPKWLVSFADDSGGEELCWSRREYEYGAIYLWDCDVNLGDDPTRTDDYAIKLADSLEDFINNMVEDEDWD